jgi:hypothetical protein
MERFLILGQLQLLAAATWETLFTVPPREAVSVTDGDLIEVNPVASVGNTQTSVNSIIVTNTGAASEFSIRLIPTQTATITAAEYVVYDTSPIGANETVVLSLGWTLPAGSYVQVDAGDPTQVNFTAVGVEIT